MCAFRNTGGPAWRRARALSLLLALLLAVISLAACRPQDRDAAALRLGVLTPTPAYKSCYDSIAQTRQSCGNATVAPALAGDSVVRASNGVSASVHDANSPVSPRRVMDALAAWLEGLLRSEQKAPDG